MSIARKLARWREAGLIDETTSARIQAFEDAERTLRKRSMRSVKTIGNLSENCSLQCPSPTYRAHARWERPHREDEDPQRVSALRPSQPSPWRVYQPAPLRTEKRVCL